MALVLTTSTLDQVFDSTAPPRQPVSSPTRILGKCLIWGTDSDAARLHFYPQNGTVARNPASGRHCVRRGPLDACHLRAGPACRQQDTVEQRYFQGCQ